MNFLKNMLKNLLKNLLQNMSNISGDPQAILNLFWCKIQASLSKAA